MNIDVVLLLKDFAKHNIRNESIVICEYIQQCIKTCSEEFDLFENYKPVRELFKNDKQKFLNFINDIMGNATFQCIPFLSKCNFIEKKLINIAKNEPNIIPVEEKNYVNNPLDIMSITTSAPTTFSNFLSSKEIIDNENTITNLNHNYEPYQFNYMKNNNNLYDNHIYEDNYENDDVSVDSFNQFDGQRFIYDYGLNDNYVVNNNENQSDSEKDESFIDYLLTPNF